MTDWKDHGISFEAGQVPWVFDEDAPKYPGVDWTRPTPFLKRMFEIDRKEGKLDLPEFPKDMLFAPDAIHKDGNYYLYFCMADSSEGVAVADRPEGPFGNPVQLPCGGIDPAVFIDDDGQAYYYWGQFAAHGAKLKDNMFEFEDGSMVENLLTEEEHYFHEGSSVRKRGDIYYFVYPCIKRGKPTALAYATGNSPLGPFRYRGIIIDNDGCDPQSWNNHGSIEAVNGQWYVFYHRSSQNGRQKRRLCIEPIFFKDDDTIDEVVMTSQGAGKPFGIDEKIEAFRASGLSGNVYTGPSGSDGRHVLKGIADGDTAVYRYVQWEKPAREIFVEASGSGEIRIYLDREKEAAGSIEVNNGAIASNSFHGPAGRHEIRMEFVKPQYLKIYEFCFKG